MIEFDIAKAIDRDIKQNKRFKELIRSYTEVLNIAVSLNENDPNIRKISKSEISKKLGGSYTATLKKIRFLQKYGYIDQRLSVIRSDIENAYPFRIMSEVHVFKIALKYYEVQNTYKRISRILGVTNEEDIRVSEGMFSYISSGRDYEDYIIGVLRKEGDRSLKEYQEKIRSGRGGERTDRI